MLWNKSKLKAIFEKKREGSKLSAIFSEKIWHFGRRWFPPIFTGTEAGRVNIHNPLPLLHFYLNSLFERLLVSIICYILFNVLYIYESAASSWHCWQSVLYRRKCCAIPKRLKTKTKISKKHFF